jgi:hypothetical protein
VDKPVLDVLYGSQTYEHNFHRFGFTPTTLRKKLEDRGLKILDEKLDGYNITVMAQKPKRKKSAASKKSTTAKKTRRRVKKGD